MLLIKPSLILITVLIISCTGFAQNNTNDVKIVGQMKNVMWKGELQGTIHLDTILNKRNLYGFGPVEYLAGELLTIDGKSYKSTVVSDSSMHVVETYDVKAPFFAYANITNWKELPLPDSIRTVKHLEAYLDNLTKHFPRPFFFKLSGKVNKATIHIVNLPNGMTVSSPDDAHKGQKNYQLTNEPVDIIGFFSTAHQAVFTHHDTYLHMHLITTDRKRMGHLDRVIFERGTIQVYLPVE